MRLLMTGVRARLMLLVLAALLVALGASAYWDPDGWQLPVEAYPALPLSRNLLTFTLAGGLVLLAIWVGGDVLVRRPITRALTAARAAAGFTPAAMKGRPGELDQLVAAVGELRDALQQRQIERDQVEKELRRLEHRLLESHKVEAVGRLAGGVVHDFNNLLTVILGRTELLRAELESDPRLSRDVELISMTGQRARGLARQLLAFSRRQHLEPKVLDLGQALLGMSSMLQRLVGDAIDLSIQIGTILGRVKVDPSQMEQVVLNLAVNARDAMPRGGQLTIEARNAVLDEDLVRRCPGARPGRHVLLEVGDTGLGMDEGTRARIFEPFFSTKGSQGTGLGLATVHGIVEQHGGGITVESEVGRGSTFRIYFPHTDEPVEAVFEPLTLEVEGAATGETVLVVDDEDVVRTLACEILRMKGYLVLEAANGWEALRLAEREANPIHLLLTDVVMPQMQGPELASRLRLVRPTTRIMYMSGYAFDVVPTWTLANVDGFLPKPFTPETLARMVREILGRGASAGVDTSAA